MTQPAVGRLRNVLESQLFPCVHLARALLHKARGFKDDRGASYLAEAVEEECLGALHRLGFGENHLQRDGGKEGVHELGSGAE
jgi:hypothetical protein